MKPRTPCVAVLGSINIDLVVGCTSLPRPGETILASSFAEVSGGKGANQAVAASRLGAHVTMIGRVGDDAYADRLLEGLASENLDTSHVLRTGNCASGMAIVAVEQSGENSIIVLPGANDHITEADVELAAEAISKCDALLVQLEIPYAAVAAAIATTRRYGVLTILDPAPVSAPLAKDLLNIDVVCPNKTEAAILLGQPIDSRSDALQAASQLRRMGPRIAIITMGSEGAAYSDSDRTLWFDSFPVEAVDTTAAGDAFAAAMAVYLAQRAALDEAIKFACAAGALTATRTGAQPSLPRRDEVEALLAN